jgi:hypothetical protein
MINTKIVATVMNTQDIIIVMLLLNFAAIEIQIDMIRLRNITTVRAPTQVDPCVDCSAFSTDTGTKNALPEH